VTTKRANGEGGVYKRKDGRWEARYMALVDGRSVRRVAYCRTREEAARRLREVLAARDRGVVAVDPQQPVSSYLRTWVEGARPTLRARSWERYEEHVRLYLVPHLGRYRLGQLSPAHVQQLYARLLDQGLSPATVRRVHAALRRALAQAVRWRLIGVNVASLVEPPQLVRREMAALSAEEVTRLLSVTRDERLEALFVVAVTAGLRRGELLALRWRDVDLEGAWLQVTGSLARTRGRGLAITQPKTARSRRRVELTMVAVDALRRHAAGQVYEREAMGALWRDADLVFCGQHGGFLQVSDVYDAFRRILDRAGLPRVRFHDLRHTAATLMLSRHVHPKVASEMLGHSTVAITLDLYSHVSGTMQREAVGVLDALFEDRRSVARE
jgi:integrase